MKRCVFANPKFSGIDNNFYEQGGKGHIFRSHGSHRRVRTGWGLREVSCIRRNTAGEKAIEYGFRAGCKTAAKLTAAENCFPLALGFWDSNTFWIPFFVQWERGMGSERFMTVSDESVKALLEKVMARTNTLLKDIEHGLCAEDCRISGGFTPPIFQISSWQKSVWCFQFINLHLKKSKNDHVVTLHQTRKD